MARRPAVPETLRPKGDMRNIVPLLRYIRPYRRQAIGSFVALVTTSGAMLGLGSGLRYLVDEGLGKGNGQLLDQAFWGLLAITLLLAVGSYARFFLMAWIGEKVVADIRKDVYKHLISMHIGFFETTRIGELLSRLTTDTTLLQNVIGSLVSVAIRNLLLLIGGFALLLVTNARLTGFVLLVVPLVVVPIILLGRQVRSLGREAQTKVADISGHAEESLNAIRAVQGLVLEPYEMQRFSGYVEEATHAQMTRIRSRSFLTALVITLVFGAIMVVLWIGGKDVLSGRMTTGQLSAFVFYSVIVAGAAAAISEIIADLQRAAGAAERLGELMSIPSEIISSAQAVAMPGNGAPRVSFEQVDFSYPTRQEKPAIHTFTLDVQPGQTIALVGPSGAGKTTIFQLLMRFYDPQRGAININGIDLREWPLAQLRGMIGMVPQDPVIFTGTARENIRLGHIDADDAALMEAAKAASALEFLQKLPQGLDTHLGEKGIQLSGGQRQRIAIARAVVRNPKLLLLDEATSALDSENEHFIQQALENLMQGRTTFVIAHRLSTIVKADQIVLMNEGRIEAIGTHKELLTKSSLYARLAELQFKSVGS